MIIPIPGPYNSNTYHHTNQHTKLHIFFRTILLNKKYFPITCIKQLNLYFLTLDKSNF